MKADLPERILAAIAKATSQRPERAADLLAKVGGEEPAFWKAIEQLYCERRISTAHIQKKGDAEPWLAVWPTGLPLGSGAWSSSSHSAMFVKHRPNDLYQAHAPRSVAKAKPVPRAASKPKPVPKPAPELKPEPVPAPQVAPTPEPETKKEIVMDAPTNLPRAKGALQAAVATHIAGRTKANALTVAEVSDLLADEPDNVRFAVRALVEKKTIGQMERVLGRRKISAFFDPAAEAERLAAEGLSGMAEVPSAAEMLTTIAEAAAPAEPAPAATVPAVDRRAPQPLYRAGDLTVAEIHDDLASLVGPAAPDAAAEPDRVRLALWDDGTLTIADGDDVLQYGPDVTRRLALLLGVSGTPFVSHLGA